MSFFVFLAFLLFEQETEIIATIIYGGAIWRNPRGSGLLQRGPICDTLYFPIYQTKQKPFGNIWSIYLLQQLAPTCY